MRKDSNARAINKEASASVPTAGVFRRKWYYAAGSALLAAAGIAILFLPVDAQISVAASVSMMMTALLGLASFFVSRVEIDEERIVYRNLFGCVRQLRWEDVLQVMDGIDNDSDILLRGTHTTIPIRYSFARFNTLRGIILEKTGYGMRLESGIVQNKKQMP